jgi:membrane fusion protein (multidrug efflux system)
MDRKPKLADAPADAGASDAAAPAAKRKAPRVMAALLATFAVVGGGVYLHGRGTESTDDAQVEGHIANVSGRVGGQVAKVLVSDNALVEAGQPLVELDPTELEARLAVASADLAAAKAGLKSATAQLEIAQAAADAKGKGAGAKSGSVSASRAQLEQARADVLSARSRLKLAEVDFERIRKLRKDGVVSASELDAKQSAFDQAKAALDQAEARVTGARIGNEVTAPAQVDAASAAVDVAAAKVDQAEAARRLAELNVAYATIKAPVRGVVSRRTVEAGQVIQPGTPLMAVIPLDDVWIVANFKEDQIAHMAPGQKAKVEVDSFGGKDLEATVDSIAGATGSKFALLPPDNASGNFVKVVQRVPVLLHLDAAKDVTLRPGMSVNVTVRTGG